MLYVTTAGNMFIVRLGVWNLTVTSWERPTTIHYPQFEDTSDALFRKTAYFHVDIFYARSVTVQPDAIELNISFGPPYDSDHGWLYRTYCLPECPGHVQ